MQVMPCVKYCLIFFILTCSFLFLAFSYYLFWACILFQTNSCYIWKRITELAAAALFLRNSKHLPDASEQYLSGRKWSQPSVMKRGLKARRLKLNSTCTLSVCAMRCCWCIGSLFNGGEKKPSMWSCASQKQPSVSLCRSFFFLFFLSECSVNYVIGWSNLGKSNFLFSSTTGGWR